MVLSVSRLQEEERTWSKVFQHDDVLCVTVTTGAVQSDLGRAMHQS